MRLPLHAFSVRLYRMVSQYANQPLQQAAPVNSSLAENTESVPIFLQMDRVYQDLAGPVFPVKSVQVVAADLEGRNPSGRVLDPDPAQVAPHAQEECTYEDVRGFIRPGDRSSPPFARQYGFFRGDKIEEESLRHLAGSLASPSIFPLAKDRKLMGFFLFSSIFLKKINHAFMIDNAAS